MEKIASSKSEAKRLGLSKYFTGKPCKRGHVAYRYAAGNCSECQRMHLEAGRKQNPERYKGYDKAYRDKNPDKVRLKNRRSYIKNRDDRLERARKYREENAEEVSRQRKSSYKRHRQKRILESGQWAKQNRGQRCKTRRKHYEQNREKIRAYNDQRRAIKLSRMPSFYSELDEFVIQEAHDLAKERAALTGFDWQVDHRIPILCEIASGLHCAANIQVIPRAINARKCNKMLYTEDLEWLQDMRQ